MQWSLQHSLQFVCFAIHGRHTQKTAAVFLSVKSGKKGPEFETMHPAFTCLLASGESSSRSLGSSSYRSPSGVCNLRHGRFISPCSAHPRDLRALICIQIFRKETVDVSSQLALIFLILFFYSLLVCMVNYNNFQCIEDNKFSTD